MANFRLSVKAEEDLTEIYTYGILRFGLVEAQKYLMLLEKSLENLAQMPFMGMDLPSLKNPCIKKFSFKSHLIFYQLDEEGLLIARILHHTRDYKSLF